MRVGLVIIGRSIGWALASAGAALIGWTIYLGGPLRLFVGMALIGVVLSSLAAGVIAFVAATVIQLADRSYRRGRSDD